MSNSLQPHGQKSYSPWDSPGKYIGVGFHFILQCMKVKSLSRVQPSATPRTAAYQAPLSMGFFEDLQDLSELTPKKDVLFIIGDWNAKVGSQETPGVTGKLGLDVQNEAGHRLIEFCQQNALVIANTLFQQHKRRLYTWASPDSQYQNQIAYILCSQRWRSSVVSENKTRS